MVNLVFLETSDSLLNVLNHAVKMPPQACYIIVYVAHLEMREREILLTRKGN